MSELWKRYCVAVLVWTCKSIKSRSNQASRRRTKIFKAVTKYSGRIQFSRAVKATSREASFPDHIGAREAAGVTL